MNKAKNILSGIFVISLVFSQTARAAVNTDVLLSVSGMADMVLLFGIIICLLWSMKIMSLELQ